jgi:hypothetical protein
MANVDPAMMITLQAMTPGERYEYLSGLAEQAAGLAGWGLEGADIARLSDDYLYWAQRLSETADSVEF